MKRFSIILVLATLGAAGCEKPPVTTFDCGDFKLAVSARIKKGKEVAITDYKPGTYYMLDAAPRQIEINARFVETSRTNTDKLTINWTRLVTDDGQEITPVSRPAGRPSGDRIPPSDRSPAIPSGGSGVPAGSGGGTDLGRGPTSGIGGPLMFGGGSTAVQTVFHWAFQAAGSIQPNTINVFIEVINDGNTRIVGFPLHVVPRVTDRSVLIDLRLQNQPTERVVITIEGEAKIAGLKNTTRPKATDQMPLVGNLPAIGKLFGQAGENQQKKNLLIIFTPRVVTMEAE